ncbi:MAG TPA: PAS domain S-box protein [Verrucomicrobiae bacterium]|nr:PAS domain S-box protein [Verrucomicrobiae bacterium]
MSWVTVIWSMLGAICLTLAGMHLLVWCKRRTTWANLLFSLIALATAAFAGCEMWMMGSKTPAEFAAAVRWLQVPAWVIVLAIVGFTRSYLGAGRQWLAWTVCGLRTFSLLIDFLVGQSLNFRVVTGLHRVPFLGEFVSVGKAVPNMWALLDQLSLLFLLIYVLDAAFTAWRRGEPRKALVTGSIAFWVLASIIESILVSWQIVQWPVTVSWFFVPVVLVMGYEMSRDVVQAAQLSDELRESEERLTLAAEAAGIGVWIWNVPDNQVWGSERWFRLFGLEPDLPVTFEQVIQRIHPDDRSMVEREVRRSMTEQSSHLSDFRVALPDGAPRWITARGRVQLDAQGKPARMLGVAIDITERKLADEKFRLTVEASPNGIVLVNAAGQMVLVNSETEKLFGYARAELIGQSVEKLVPERFRGAHPGFRTGFHASPQARAMGAGRELFARRKDGTEFPVEIGLRPIQSAEGTLVLTVIVDITQRKQSEQEARSQRDELAHLSRVTMLGELSSSIAHELNQPLGAILRNAEAAELFLQDPSPDLEELRAILADIRRDDQRAGAVISRMRSLVKRREVERSLLDPKSLAADVINLVHTDAASRRVRMVFESASPLPPVRGDRVQLQQVLLNLLLNAMDAVTDCAPENRRVTIRLRAVDAQVELAVSDTGRGIPSDKLNHVFEPFFSTKPNGMGLGLPISRKIVEAHGGRLWAENNPAAGATFYFTLPADNEAQQGRQELSETEKRA